MLRIRVLMFALLALSLFASDAFGVYDCRMGRFLTRDPVGYVDGENLYEYVRSRPIVDRDPMGLCSQENKKSPCSLPTPVDAPVVWPNGFTPGPGVHPGDTTVENQNCCKLYWASIPSEGQPNRQANTVCCGGKKITCVYKPAEQFRPRQPEDDLDGLKKGWQLANVCMIEHEQRHIGQTTSCQGVSDGKEPPELGLEQAVCGHCKIWQAHIDCLEMAKAKCQELTTPEQVKSCTRILNDYIRGLQNNINKNGCKELDFLP